MSEGLGLPGWSPATTERPCGLRRGRGRCFPDPHSAGLHSHGLRGNSEASQVQWSQTVARGRTALLWKAGFVEVGSACRGNLHSSVASPALDRRDHPVSQGAIEAWGGRGRAPGRAAPGPPSVGAAAVLFGVTGQGRAALDCDCPPSGHAPQRRGCPGACVLVSVSHLPPFARVLGRAGSDHTGPAPGGGLRFPGHSEERLRQTHALLAALAPERLPHNVRRAACSAEGCKMFAFHVLAVTSLHFSREKVQETERN